MDWQQGTSPSAAAASGPRITPTPVAGKRGLFGGIISDVKSDYSKAKDGVENAFPTIAETASTTTSISIGPTATDQSPWGNAKSLGVVGMVSHCSRSLIIF